MSTENKVKLERYRYIEQQLRQAKEAKYEAEKRVKEEAYRVEMFTSWLKEFPVCSYCNGYGRIREWIAQDESILNKCSSCDGSGCA